MSNGAARMGKVIADLAARSNLAAKAAALPGEMAAKARDREALLEATERELAKTIRPLFAEMAAHPDTPPEVKDLLDTIVKPGRQFDAIIQIFATAISVFSFAGAIAQPMVTEVGQSSWALRPKQQLSPADAAAAVVRGELSHGDGEVEALKSGVNAERFALLVAITGMAPGPQELGEMLRRGIIDDALFRSGIAHGNLKTEWADQLAALRFEVLPAAEAVAAAVQDVLPYDAAAAAAELGGFKRDVFDVLYQVAGNPPGLGEMLELWRRGAVDEPTVRKAIAESRTKTKYTDALLALRYEQPSPQQVIEGDVQGQLDHAAALDKYTRAGGNPDDYEWLFGVAGNPLAVGQALELWNRGEMSEAEVDQVIRESRTKTKYTAAVKKLAVRLPTLRDIWRLLQHGTWTEEQAVAQLRELGYAPDVAAAIAASHVAEAQAPDTEYAKGEVRALYQAELITRQRAHDLLVALGKSSDYADYMLDLDDARIARAKLDRDVNVVRTKFLSFRITEAEATETLDAIGVAAPARDAYLDEWDALRQATTKDLTEANLATALKRGLITGNDYAARLEKMGYTPEDAQLMLAIRGGAA